MSRNYLPKIHHVQSYSVALSGRCRHPGSIRLINSCGCVAKLPKLPGVLLFKLAASSYLHLPTYLPTCFAFFLLCLCHIFVVQCHFVVKFCIYMYTRPVPIECSKLRPGPHFLPGLFRYMGSFFASTSFSCTASLSSSSSSSTS